MKTLNIFALAAFLVCASNLIGAEHVLRCKKGQEKIRNDKNEVTAVFKKLSHAVKSKKFNHEELLERSAFTVYTTEEIDAKLCALSARIDGKGETSGISQDHIEKLLERIRVLEERCQNLEASSETAEAVEAEVVEADTHELAIAEIDNEESSVSEECVAEDS